MVYDGESGGWGGYEEGQVQRKTKREAVLKKLIFDLDWTPLEYEFINLHVSQYQTVYNRRSSSLLLTSSTFSLNVIANCFLHEFIKTNQNQAD